MKDSMASSHNRESSESVAGQKAKTLKDLNKEEMPLKHKIMLGPIEKYKLYSKINFIMIYRSISMEADLDLSLDLFHINASIADHRVNKLIPSGD